MSARTCHQCGAPSEGFLCAPHMARRNENDQRRRAELVAAKRCVRCREPNDRAKYGKAQCSACLELRTVKTFVRTHERGAA